ncbi:MAG: thiamine-phosphate kinase [Bacteroidales bacterium]|nr:thiamine-phosphate kinase [Bacteroidales bacterium]
MADENFSSLGRIEAINKLYEGTPYTPFDSCWFETSGRAYCTIKSKTLLEGIDFDLTYFPLKHLGYKSVIYVTGELYAEMSAPRALEVVIGISAKLDFEQIRQIWEGIVTAAKEHGYKKVGLDLVPSRNGLSINICASGETSVLEAKRRPAAKSMDLICVSGNLGAAFLGLNVLEREKMKFAKTKDNLEQPDLEKYKHLVGAYLKPSLPANLLKELEDSEITPSFGYFVTRGLGDTLRHLTKDSGLGAKVYMDRMPFAGDSFTIGKELEIDPVTAAMNGGDDCRLLFTIPIGKHDKFRHDFQNFDIIGHLAKPEVGAVLVTPDGVELPVKAQGWKE